jgi:hypothetical protein
MPLNGAGMRRHLRPSAACGASVGAAESFVSFIPLLGGLDQHSNLPNRLVEYVGWNTIDYFRMPNAPVETLDLVRQHHALNLDAWRKHYLEWVALTVRTNRTQQGKTDATIVGRRRDDERWPLASLLMTRLRIELQPHHVTPLWDVALGHLPDLPTDGPSATDLAVTIAAIDRLQQVTQAVLVLDRLDNQAVAFDGNVNCGAFDHVCLNCKRMRDPQG